MDTKHAVAGADDQALRLPYGSVCQGCHTANFDPAKVVPTPTATSSAGAVSWAAGNGMPTQPQTEGNAASSENFVGCSSCHYGMQIDGNFGSDPNNTAHRAPLGLLASAEDLRSVPFAVLVHGPDVLREPDPDAHGVAAHADPAADGTRRVPDARGPRDDRLESCSSAHRLPQHPVPRLVADS